MCMCRRMPRHINLFVVWNAYLSIYLVSSYLFIYLSIYLSIYRSRCMIHIYGVYIHIYVYHYRQKYLLNDNVGQNCIDRAFEPVLLSRIVLGDQSVAWNWSMLGVAFARFTVPCKMRNKLLCHLVCRSGLPACLNGTNYKIIKTWKTQGAPARQRRAGAARTWMADFASGRPRRGVLFMSILHEAAVIVDSSHGW